MCIYISLISRFENCVADKPVEVKNDVLVLTQTSCPAHDSTKMLHTQNSIINRVDYSILWKD
jgi:hypothetical protein